MPYDPSRRSGWAKGLIHFHTRYSDGWATVLKAAEIAASRDYDYLLITDHLQNVRRKGLAFESYVRECEDAAAKTGILVVPGGEIEIHWENAATLDRSEAHTLAPSIRPLVAHRDLDNPDPQGTPFGHWTDSAGGRGTILAVQEKLRARGLPALASHQFQHSLVKPGPGPEHPDYRYDLERIGGCQALDFFYSGLIDVAHEPEDFILYQSFLEHHAAVIPWVYSSCDYHVGPEVYTQHPAVHRPLKVLLGIFTGLKSDPEAKMFVEFSKEQLSHATYVWIGNRPLTEETLLEALGGGRTLVTRGRAEVGLFSPPPGRPGTDRPAFTLEMPQSYQQHRPRSVIVLRDGQVVHWRVFSEADERIQFAWSDTQAPPGRHNYVIYIPSKLVTSPIQVTVE